MSRAWVVAFACCWLTGCDRPTPPTPTSPSASATPQPAAGADWEVVTPRGAGGNFTAVQFLTPTDGWLLGKGRLLYHTTDGGTTATQVVVDPDPIPPVETTTALAFADAQHAFLGGNRKSYSSLDGGLTWKAMPGFETGSTQSPGVTAIVFPTPTEGALVYQGAIYLSHDAGSTWTRDKAYTQVPVALAKAGGTLVALSNKNLSRLTPGGWKDYPLPTGDNGQARSVSFPSELTGFVFLRGTFGGQSTVYKTADGGQHWLDVYDVTGDVGQVRFADDGRGWIVHPYNFTLEATTTGGAHWATWPGYLYNGQGYSYEGQHQFYVLDATHAWFVTGDKIVRLKG